MDKSLAESILSFISIFVLMSVFTLPLFRGILMIMNISCDPCNSYNSYNSYNKNKMIKNLEGSTWIMMHSLLSLLFSMSFLKNYMDIIATIGFYVGIASPCNICLISFISYILSNHSIKDQIGGPIGTFWFCYALILDDLFTKMKLLRDESTIETKYIFHITYHLSLIISSMYYLSKV